MISFATGETYLTQHANSLFTAWWEWLPQTEKEGGPGQTWFDADAQN